jgi:hypothetical protein
MGVFKGEWCQRLAEHLDNKAITGGVGRLAAIRSAVSFGSHDT